MGAGNVQSALKFIMSKLVFICFLLVTGLAISVAADQSGYSPFFRLWASKFHSTAAPTTTTPTFHPRTIVIGNAQTTCYTDCSATAVTTQKTDESVYLELESEDNIEDF
eukprot:TRINITY_DN1735_c0_g1_i1.p1 TRINITY_DN1735_c0_g1~~TRINITY_DN1735_c0_g1_i1.p1  ORF type:complete len:109 (+),score=5.85 TRINITY_DN1735_c0_g1_i1:47-373(+)